MKLIHKCIKGETGNCWRHLRNTVSPKFQHVDIMNIVVYCNVYTEVKGGVNARFFNVPTFVDDASEEIFPWIREKNNA